MYTDKDKENDFDDDYEEGEMLFRYYCVCFESKERLPPTKKKKKKYLSRLRRDDDNRKGPPHIKVDRSTSSSNNARDFDDFDFDAEEEEEETRKKKKRDLSVFLSFQQKRGDQSRSFLLLRGGFFAPFLNTPPKQPGEREYLLR